MMARATMRLQLHVGFTFDHAAELVPYLAALGISHVYVSPITTARAGSMHGYDVVDPSRVNPELGGEDGLRRLVAMLRRHRLGLIVDIVPNHMHVGDGTNVWWEDVLQHGRASRWSKIFDIDWDVDDPALRGKVLLPILGAPYGEALARGELRLRKEEGKGLVLRHRDRVLPISDQGRREIAGCSGDHVSGEALHRFLECQNYRLAWWHVAGDEINWRRFFEVNDLAAVHVEEEEVFELTHGLLLRLYGEGLVDGVRVDHVDGLADPPGYCRRLRHRLSQAAGQRPPEAPAGPAYLVVEKILGPDERLPDDWGVDGTSGYDFMDEISAVLHDPGGESILTELWTGLSGRPPRFEDEERQARRELLARSFTAQLEGVVSALHTVARAGLATRDVSRGALRRTLSELLAHFPAYRTYAGRDGRSLEDAMRFDRAVERAAQSCLAPDRPLLDVLDRWLGGEPASGADADLRMTAIRRFEQLSAPIAAKAVEDTAFYRYGRLLSRTDVGFDVARFSSSVDEFHAKTAERRLRFPLGMLATATHDHKRGEDVRARLAVLSELASDWSVSVRRWMLMNAQLRGNVEGRPAPQAADEMILYQMIVGAWPVQLALDDHKGRFAFAERLAAWQEKAMREAKLVTDWIAQDVEQETAARDFVTVLVAAKTPSESLTEMAAFARRIGPAGAINGLAQTVVKLTSPGVPDFYQGTEFWDQSLVDPDNRRPVDFAARRAALEERARPGDLVPTWRDARLKQAVIARVLAFRGERPALFTDGPYVPLAVEGPRADRVIAFARILGKDVAIVVACRLMAEFLPPGDGIRVPPAVWAGTRLHLPEHPAATRLGDVLSDTEVVGGRTIELGDILRDLPIALLASR